MRRYSAFIFLALSIPLCYPAVGRAQERGKNLCTVCHGKEKVEFDKSVHAQRGVQCVDCHGGDPNALEVDDAKSPSSGFVGSIDDDLPPFSKVEIVELCASCHSDRRKMKQYGIPTDQLEQYRTSQHGEALFKRGDTNMAICTDCHGKHVILPSSDPQSMVYMSNIPSMCARCHSDVELMKKYDAPSDILEKYTEGVHGRALLGRGNRGSPECARCHGTHGATPPGVTEVGSVCGQCHLNTRDYFNRSPHKAAMDEKMMEECASCHGNHAVSGSSVEMFDTMCINCHEKGSGAFRRGQKIKAMLIAAQGAMDDAKAEIERAKLKGINVEDEEMVLEDARTEIIRVLPVQHTLSVEEVERYTRKAKAAADDVKFEIHETLQGLRLRKFGLGIAWLFIFFVVSIIYMKSRALKQRSVKGER